MAGRKARRAAGRATVPRRIATDPALATWLASLNNRATAPAAISVIADSITEGQGATVKNNRWLSLFRDSMRAAYPTSGVVGGENYLPAHYFVYGADSSSWANTQSSSSGTISYEAWPGNLGYRVAIMSTGAVMTFTVTGTSVDIWYLVGGGTFTYRVDSGSVVTVNTAGTYSTAGRVTGVSLGAAGSHTVTITATTGPANISGLTVYNGDTNAGIQVFDSSHTGATLAMFTANQADFKAALALTNPDLILIELGANDANGGLSVGTWQTNMTAFINDLLTLPTNPSIMLVAAYNPLPSFVATSTWQTYVTAMKTIAAGNPTHVTVMDLSVLMPTASVSGTYFSSDGLHPNNAGHAAIAGYIQAALTASGSTGGGGGGGAGDVTAMPTTNLPGWNLLYNSDFTQTYALGAVTTSDEYWDWFGYDGQSDTSRNRPARLGPPNTSGLYESSSTVSMGSSILDVYLHTDGTRPKVCTMVPPSSYQTYGRYAVRMKADPVAGYKTAFLLWPTSNNWNEGEVDFPEGLLNGTFRANPHQVSASPGSYISFQDHGGTYGTWHTFVIEWSPGRLSFGVDGVFETTTNSLYIPTTNHYWALQIETNDNSDTPPATGANGHVAIDWVAQWTYAP